MSNHQSEPPNAGQMPVVRNIFDVSAEFLGQLKTWLEQNPPAVRIDQVIGFSQFGVSCYAENLVGAAVATSAFTLVAFPTERWDTSGCHDTVTNNSRITIPANQDGIYDIVGWVRWPINATGTRELLVLVNGVEVMRVSQPAAPSAVLTGQNIHIQRDLSATDYVELQVWQDSGGSLTFDMAALIVSRMRGKVI